MNAMKCTSQNEIVILRELSEALCSPSQVQPHATAVMVYLSAHLHSPSGR